MKLSSSVKLILQSQIKLSIIIWLVLITSVFVYLFTGQTLIKEFHPFSQLPDIWPAMRNTLIIMALLAAGLSFLSKKIILSVKNIKKILDKPAPRYFKLKKQKLPEREVKLLKILPIWFTSFLVRWVLCESVALFGLSLAFFKEAIDIYLPFGLLSLVLLFVHRPSEKSFLKLAHSHHILPQGDSFD